MLHLAHDQRGAAFIIRAVEGSLAFLALQVRTAYRAIGDIVYRLRTGLPPLQIHADDLGDDLAALLYIHPIAFVQVQPHDLVGVMQCSAFHRGPRQEYRFQVSHRCHSARAAHLVAYALQFGFHLLRLVFVCDSPARRFGGKAQLFLLRIAIHLNHNAVDIITEVEALVFPIAYEFQHFVDFRTQAAFMIYGEAQASHSLQAFPMRSEQTLFGIKKIHKSIQRTFSHLTGILQLNGTRGKIPWVSVWWLAVFNAFLIQFFESLQVHKHLTAYLELVRVIAFLQPLGYAADGFYVGGHHVTLCTITTGNGAHQVVLLLSFFF